MVNRQQTNSVLGFSRPPRLETQPNTSLMGQRSLTRTKRVLETSHPPVYYIPPSDIKMEQFDAPQLVS